MLLVEDNPANVLVASKFLTKWEIETDTAENGQLALNAVKESEPYDLILMDLQMPVMDGYEATRKIRQLPDTQLNKIPIIALTASNSTRG